MGGTTLRRHPTSKALLQEIAWIDGGGGISPNYVRPAYQNAISKIVGSNRGFLMSRLLQTPEQVDGYFIHPQMILIIIIG